MFNMTLCVICSFFYTLWWFHLYLQQAFHCLYIHIVIAWMGDWKWYFHNTPYSWVGSVCEPSSSLFPTAMILPSTPWSFCFCFWINRFILFSLHSWEKNVDICLLVWLISHLMSSSSIPCLQWIRLYFSFGLHNTLLDVQGSIRMVCLHMGYIIRLYPFICWWTCRLTPHPKCCSEHTSAGILVCAHAISLSSHAGVGKVDRTKVLVSALQWIPQSPTVLYWLTSRPAVPRGSFRSTPLPASAYMDAYIVVILTWKRWNSTVAFICIRLMLAMHAKYSSSLYQSLHVWELST